MDGMFGFCKSDDSIPIGHLDYTYIGQCQDVKELEKIVKILRSGEEGIFPELVKFAESKLEVLNPKSKVLDKETPVKTLRDLEEEEKNDILNDLEVWANEVNSIDKSLGHTSNGDVADFTDLPPIRSSAPEQKEKGKLTDKQKEENGKLKSTKRVAPRSYNEWDKIDVEKEIQKVEADKSSSKVNETKLNKKEIPISPKVDLPTKDMPKDELLMRANYEKEKGNESFKAGDFEEALLYYNRSLSISPTAAVFNNRAITSIKLQRYSEAIEDCNRVLEEESNNIKAYLRRGLAHKHLGKTLEAMKDFECVLETEPQNRRAKELLREMEKFSGDQHHKDGSHSQTSNAKKGRRVLIEEVDNVNQSTKLRDSNEKESSNKGARLKIEELDNSNDRTKVNGHVTEKVEDTISIEQPQCSKKGKRLKIVEVDNSQENAEPKIANKLSSEDPAVSNPDRETINDSPTKNYRIEEHDSWLNITASESDVLLTTDSDDEKSINASKDNLSEIKGESLAAAPEDFDSSGKTHTRSNNLQSEESKSSNLQSPNQSSDLKSEENESNRQELPNGINNGAASAIETDKDIIKAGGFRENCVSPNSTLPVADVQSKIVESVSDTDLVNLSQQKTEPAAPTPPPPLPANVLRVKDEGNTYYKAGNYAEAIKKYTKCMELLKTEKEVHTTSFAVLLSNRAMCKTKIGDCQGCIKDCNESLELSVTTKALLRRAGAYETLERYGHAYVDYQAALRMDNSIKTAWDASTRLTSALRDQHGPSWREKLPSSTTKIPNSISSPTLFDSLKNIVESKATNSNQSVKENAKLTPESAQAAGSAHATQSVTHPGTKPSSGTQGTNLINVEDTKSEDVQGSKSISHKPQIESRNVEDKATDTKNNHTAQERSKVEVNTEKVQTTEEKFKERKDKGNNCVQKQQFQEAVGYYTECIDIMPHEVASYTNRALCYLKLNEATKAEADCSKALELSPNNVKALFRRGQARKMSKRHKEALQDLTNLLKLEPGNTVAKKELDATKELWREELRQIQASNKKSSNDDKNSKDQGKKGKKRVKIKEVDSITQTTCPRKEAEHRSPQKPCNNSASEPPRSPQKTQMRKF